jgi:hypothetical protein
MHASIPESVSSDSLEDLFRQSVASRAEPFWPAWQMTRHLAGSGAPAYVFRYDDIPLITALGAYRKDDGIN